MIVATFADSCTTVGFSAWVVSVGLLIFSLLALLVGVILRVSSRRFTSLIFEPAFGCAVLSMVLDLLGSIVCYASEGSPFFGWAWHAGQSGVALLVGTIAFVLLRKPLVISMHRHRSTPGRMP